MRCSTVGRLAADCRRHRSATQVSYGCLVNRPFLGQRLTDYKNGAALTLVVGLFNLHKQ